MHSVPHTPDPEQFRRNVADLFGDRDTTPTASPAPDWPQAVAQVGAALCTKLGLQAPPERIRKALDLVLAHAVTIHDDGTASVQSGTQTYTLAPHCLCADARNRPELCKHDIAVELHRRALKLCNDTAPAAPPANVLEASPSTPPLPSVSGTAAWLVQEAPTSACFKWRIGQAELMYTFRGVTDDDVLTRIREHLPLLQEILAACETRAAERPTVREAPQPPQAPPPQTKPQAQPNGHARLQQARHQAQETPRNGHANDRRNGHNQRSRPTGDQDTAWCSLHNVAMKQHVNERGTWFSHTIGNGRYCKGDK